MSKKVNPGSQNMSQQQALTYSAGEDEGRLKSAAKYFGIKNTRTPLKSVRETPSENPNHPTENNHSRSILKFGSTVWSNVGLLFSDSTLEAARMHSVGVTAQEERVAGDGTLHLMSVAMRRKGAAPPTYEDLTDLFHQKPLEPLELEVRAKDEEYEEVLLDSVEGGSITAAIFGIVKGTVGPAVLYLPRGFALSGYAIAIPAMLVATTTYLYSATRLLQCWKAESEKTRLSMEKLEEVRLLLDPNSSVELEGAAASSYGSMGDPHLHLSTNNKLLTYPELARRAFGKGSFLISGGIAAMQFGVCLTYLIFVPQNLYEATKELFGIEVPKQMFLAFMLAMEIPLCWIRDIRKLTPINILATALIAFGLVSVLFIALANPEPFSTMIKDGVGNESESENELENLEWDLSELFFNIVRLPKIQPTWVLFIGTSFFCFEGSISLIVPLQEAVYKKADRARFAQVNQKVTTSIVAFYICFSIICWASFQNPRTALTASLPEGILSTLVQFAYSFAVIFTFPLQAFPALEVVCQTTGTKTGKSSAQEESSILKRNIISTVIIWLLGLLAIVAINYLGNVVSLLGSFVGIPIALVYPPLMHNVLVPKSSKTTKLMNCCLSFVGALAAGAASYTTIASWDEGAEG